jgi:hypothetical protein
VSNTGPTVNRNGKKEENKYIKRKKILKNIKNVSF